MTVLSHILEHKLVAIIRGMPATDTVAIAEALYAGGIRNLEVTLNSPDALQVIARLADVFKNRMQVGAGTVITTADAANAIDAGATFLVSPSLDEGVIKAANKAGVVSIPGALTPTEIVAAHHYGADIIKVFPCPDVGYLKAILAPLNHIRMMPTGGVDAYNIKAYETAGAVAFGIGSALVNNRETIDEAYLEELTIKAIKLIAALI
ncbi:MAG: bifunctional 4-hydroxy-2-oxoglutarate aldolase/2-dehydro-3-deoxy-phosphogluconate aldolase [Bacteroidota bacterium]